MLRPEVVRWALSVAAVAGAGLIGTVLLTAPAGDVGPLRIEWSSTATSAASSSATRSCSEMPSGGRGVGLGPKCPVSLSLAPRNTLGLAATALVPGATAQRAVDVTNDGKVALSGVTFAVRSSTSTPLTDGSATGVQVRVDRCASAWTESINGGGIPTYTCSGGSQVVVAERPAPLTPVTLAGSPAVARDGVDHLRVTLRLPSTSGLATAARRAVLTYSFQAVQKTGQA